MAARVLLVGAGGDRQRPDHFGCKLVSEVLLKAFEPVRAIPVTQPPSKRDTDGIDFVIVNAEGSTHHDRNAHLYRDWKRPAVMINGVWQANKRVDLSPFLYVSVRESLSAEAMRGCGVEVEVVPDVMLMHELEPGSGGGKPFACYPSNTHKTPGMLADAGLSEHYHRTAGEAIQNCPIEPSPKAAAYLVDARDRIGRMLANVKELIAQCAS